MGTDDPRALVRSAVPSEIAAAFLPRIQGLIDPTARLARLTTILPASALTDDVTFDATFPGEVPRQRVVENAPFRRRPRAPWLVLGTALALTAVFRRGRRSW